MQTRLRARDAECAVRVAEVDGPHPREPGGSED